MERLKRRTDFKAAAQGARAQGAIAPADAFVLQARQRGIETGGSADKVRVGFTVSRQVGNAVERNRVRRRLREMVRLAPSAALRSGHDYVVIGRRAALDAAFTDMARQFDAALRRVHLNARNGQEGVAAEPSGGPGAVPHKAGSPVVRDRRARRVTSHATSQARQQDTNKSG